MNKNTEEKSAASPRETGNSPKTQNENIAVIWLRYFEVPDNKKNLNDLARNLDHAFRSRLPNGRYVGILKGGEDEVRQEAYLLLVSSYLPGNQELLAATEERNLPEISNQIEKSLRGSIRSTFQTLRKSRLRHLQLHAYGGDPDDGPARYIHPAHYTKLWDLPFEAQRDLVFTALRIAVQKKKLKRKQASAAYAMIDRAMSQQQLATKLGVSRQAIHQQLQPVREYLQSHIESEEFPLK